MQMQMQMHRCIDTMDGVPIDLAVKLSGVS
jgi:hypothetical protein